MTATTQPHHRAEGPLQELLLRHPELAPAAGAVQDAHDAIASSQRVGRSLFQMAGRLIVIDQDRCNKVSVLFVQPFQRRGELAVH